MQAIRSLGVEISLDKQDHYKRWWHQKVVEEDSPKNSPPKEKMMSRLSRGVKVGARRSLESLKDLEYKKKSPRDYLEKIPIHFSDDDVDSFQHLRRENKKLKKSKKEL